MKLSTTILTCIITIFLFTGGLNITMAQEQGDSQTTQPQGKTSIGVDPAIIEIILEEETPSSRVITLSNLTNFPIPIKTLKQSFAPNEKQKIPKDLLKRYDSSSWITINDDDTDFILQANELKSIELTITQPKNADPGGHYATIYFQPLIPAGFVQEKSVFVYSRIAVLVFMQVKGDIEESLGIKEFNVNFFNETLPIDINLTLYNNGNTHLLPTINYKVYNLISNETVETLNGSVSILLPGLDKTYSSEIHKNLPLGLYRVVGEVKYGMDQTIVTTDRVTFIIMPYKNIIIILILGIWSFFFRRRIVKSIKILMGHKVLEKPKLSLNLDQSLKEIRR